MAMDVNRDEICKSLMDWFSVLMANDESLKPSNRSDISDGIAMARALHNLGPEFFTDTWMSKMKQDVGTNWRLKASNLKKIVESIFDYYTDVLNMALNDIIRPDVMKIAEKNDRRELGRLLQLVLGCAINCPLKLDYIRQIMELEESLQRNIMRAIQELDETLQGSLASKNTSLSINNFDTKLIQEDRDRLAQKCHEAANQIALLQEEKSLLQHEVNKLQRDLDRQEGPKTQLIGDDGSSLGPMQPGSTRYNDLRRQLDSLKDELLQTETQRDDFKIRTQQLENDVVMLRLKLDENSHVNEQLIQLKDELDAVREANDKLKASEALVLTYKKKLEDYSDLKRQLKQMEERNAEYIQQNQHQEENMKKMSALKGQVELYKKEIQDLHTRLDAEINKTVKIEFELNQANTQLASVQRENGRLIAERDSLQEAYDNLSASQGLNEVADSNAISNELSPPALREKLHLLEEENKALREGQGGQTALAQMLADANQRSEKLREQLKTANQKILQLQTQTDDPVKLADTANDAALDSKSQIEIVRLQNKCSHLESDLMTREQELAQVESKFRKYTEKAKEVIKALDSRNSNDSVHLGEKSAEHEADLLSSSPVRQTMSPLEERLLTTAYYNLSIACQRDVVDARLALLNGGQSFLSRQRQPVARKASSNRRTK